MIGSIDTLPPAIARRERVMGEFTVALARRLPEVLRTPVAFCGPASFREPEIDNCWHPYLIRKGFIFFLFDQVVPLARAFAGGVRRFFLGRFGVCTFIPNASASVLGITPLSICTFTTDGVQTRYCHPDDVKKMAWIVFDEAGKEKNGYGITRFVIFKVYIRILWCWFTVSIFGLRKKDWAVASTIMLRWIIGLQWVTLWMFSKKVSSVFVSTKPKKVFCVHEMHPWARIVWNEAERLHVPTITIQHAAYHRAKLWFFPTRDEHEAGLKTPKHYAVFSEKEKALLSPFFPTESRFYFGCGPRFAHWQTIHQERYERERSVIVFASSIPWWDNETVLLAARKLTETINKQYHVVIRLHPLAVVPRYWKRWLHRMTRKGIITISHSSLQEDIQRSIAVVGMNTTVLEEAVLMGRTVFVLKDERYLSFGTDLGIHVDLQSFDWSIIEQHLRGVSGFLEKQRQQGRMALGIDSPVFRIAMVS